MTTARSTPQVVICETPEAAAQRVATTIADAVRAQPRMVLGLATGGTPIAVYERLVALHREEGLDFSQASSFNLDEYVGLPPEHPQSYRSFMQKHLFDHINIQRDRTHVPDGMAEDLQTHADHYEAQIAAAGGIDLQLLGIGANGHIAFNEPGSPADSRTRVVDLTEKTIRDNSRFFDAIDQVPRRAITMGIGTILEAKKIVLMATGERKAEAVQNAIQGPRDPRNPASLLQQHEHVLFILDQAAACRIT